MAILVIWIENFIMTNFCWSLMIHEYLIFWMSDLPTSDINTTVCVSHFHAENEQKAHESCISWTLNFVHCVYSPSGDIYTVKPLWIAQEFLTKVAKFGPFPCTIRYKSCLFYPSCQANSFERLPSWMAFIEGFHVHRCVSKLSRHNGLSP